MKKRLSSLLFFGSILLPSFFLNSSISQAQTPGPDIGAFLPEDDQYNPNPWDYTNFSTYTGHKLNIFLWYQSIGEHLDRAKLDPIAGSGSIIQLAWEPWDPGAPDPVNQPQYKLTNIINGNWDVDIRRWADEIKIAGYEIWFRPMAEMNGDWLPWGCGNAVANVPAVNGNSPADYIPAYKHIHDIFVQEGVTNVKWVWAPNRDNSPSSNIQATDVAQYTYDNYYPDHLGNSCWGTDGQYNHPCVDYIGIDGYNFGIDFSWSNWQELDQVFGPSYDVFSNRITNNPGISPKPALMIAEMSSTEDGGNKASWITNAYNYWLPYRFPLVKNVTWFNQKKPEGQGGTPPIIDWRISSSTSSQSNFFQAMQALYDRSYFINFTDNQGSNNWLLAANPIATNNSNPVSPDLTITGGSSQKLSPDPINPDTTSNRFLSGFGGPVKLTTHEIDQTNHVDTKAIVSQRTLWPNVNGNLEEVLGRDYAKLSDYYYWPWYDQVTPGFTDWVVVSNLNPFDVWCEIRIAGALRWNGIIQPNANAAPTFAGTSAGPVEVQTWVSDTDTQSGQQKKLTPAYCVPSQRVLYNNRLNELHGISSSELSDRYLWTWYDWASPESKGDWVVIANPNDFPVNYTVKIAGTIRAANTIPAHGIAYPTFQGTRGGLVEVTATDSINNPANVIASQRSVWNYSFEEVPGLPASTTGGYSEQKDDYSWTWYDSSHGSDDIVVSNPSPSQTIYFSIKIAGTVMLTPQALGPNQTTYRRYSLSARGPVEVLGCSDSACSGPANIIGSQRVIWNGNFTEVLGTSTK